MNFQARRIAKWKQIVYNRHIREMLDNMSKWGGKI